MKHTPHFSHGMPIRVGISFIHIRVKRATGVTFVTNGNPSRAKSPCRNHNLE
jgi:hypothetical protein